jgi:YHS domain-containing protein/thiol-disulfide isomerase/thioredoxin
MGSQWVSGFVLVTFICTTATAGHGPGWQSSFEEAEQIAQSQQVPLLLHFHAAWCGPCKKMEQQVFTAPSVQRALQEGLAAVQVDTSRRPDIAQRFGATTIPRDVVVYPDGAVETLGVGFVPQPSYLAILRDTAARGRMIAMTRREQEPEGQDIGQRPDTSVQVLPEVRGDEIDEEIIGLSGYCPVMLSDRKEWLPGSADISERHRGVLYYFSAPKQRDRFVENPDRYAPRNLGCDPVLLARDQRAITGRIRYGLFFDGNLYLFRTAENREEFRRQPLKYTRIQHAIKPTELSGQTFR